MEEKEGKAEKKAGESFKEVHRINMDRKVTGEVIRESLIAGLQLGLYCLGRV